MNFMLTPVVTVNEDDISIVITLNDGFQLEGDEDDITVWQDVELDDDNDPVLDEDGNEIPVQVDYDVEMDADGKNIVITLNDDGVNADPEDEDDVQPVPARMNEAVFVRIVGLKNPTGVGLQNLVSVKQGPYATAPYPEFMLGSELSTTVAGAAVRIKISTRAGSTIPPGDDIVVTLKDFILPATIDERQVLIDGAEAFGPGGLIDAYDGNPSAISISGDKINLVIPTTTGAGGDIDDGHTGWQHLHRHLQARCRYQEPHCQAGRQDAHSRRRGHRG